MLKHPDELVNFKVYMTLMNYAKTTCIETMKMYNFCSIYDDCEPLLDMDPHAMMTNSDWEGEEERKIRESNASFHYTSLALSYMLPKMAQRAMFLVRTALAVYDMFSKNHKTTEQHIKAAKNLKNHFKIGLTCFRK